MDKELNSRYDFLLNVIVAASKLALDFSTKRKTLKIDKKNAQDFVSAADKKVELFLTEQIIKNFPDDEVFGEETQMLPRKNSGFWVIDPIDGTLPFLTGVPNWCISVAYVQQNKPVLGAVFDPNLNELFHAQINGKSFLNNTVLTVNKKVDLSFGMVGYGFSPNSNKKEVLKTLDKFIANDISVYKIGSGAIMLCYTAAGRLNAYFEARINSWDVAAGIIICQQAGLQCSSFASGEWLLLPKHILIAPPKIYGQMADMIGRDKFDFDT